MLRVKNSRCQAVTKRMELSGTLVLENDIPRRCKRLIDQDRGQPVFLVHSKMKIYVSDLQGMNNTRNITQYCQENVDEEVGIATALKENTKRRQEDGEDDLADVAIVRTKLVFKFRKSSTETQIRREANRWR